MRQAAVGSASCCCLWLWLWPQWLWDGQQGCNTAGDVSWAAGAWVRWCAMFVLKQPRGMGGLGGGGRPPVDRGVWWVGVGGGGERPCRDEAGVFVLVFVVW